MAKDIDKEVISIDYSFNFSIIVNVCDNAK